MTQSKPWETYEPRRENILKMFHAVQRLSGSASSINDQDLAAIAEYLNISLAEASGVLSFYQTFSRKPRGRHVIRVCDSLSCRITGSLEVYQELRAYLGIGKNQTTPDGEFTLEVVNCLGTCDTAPNLMIDDLLFTNVSPRDIPVILNHARNGQEAAI